MKSSHVEPGLSPAEVSPSVHIPQTPIVDTKNLGSDVYSTPRPWLDTAYYGIRPLNPTSDSLPAPYRVGGITTIH